MVSKAFSLLPTATGGGASAQMVGRAGEEKIFDILRQPRHQQHPGGGQGDDDYLGIDGNDDDDMIWQHSNLK